MRKVIEKKQRVKKLKCAPLTEKNHLRSDEDILKVLSSKDIEIAKRAWKRKTHRDMVLKSITGLLPKNEDGAEGAGRKDDNEKLRWDLLPWDGVEQIVGVLNYGARKYAPENWKLVKDARNRYFAAACRHLFAWFRGEKLDPESGLPHLAHVGCCILFLMHFDKESS